MRINYVFRHLDKSDFIKAFAQGHIEKALNRLNTPNDNLNGIVKLEMENSPQQPGKDVYSCEIHVNSKRHGNLIIKKRTSNMYAAISDATDRLTLLLSKIKGKYKARRRSHKRTEVPQEIEFSPLNVSNG